jgi:hypothetical protein
MLQLRGPSLQHLQQRRLPLLGFNQLRLEPSI